MTNTPIYEDDPCVMVVINEARWKEYAARSPLYLQFGEDPDDWQVVDSVHRGTYNDYAWLNEIPTQDIPLPAVFFHVRAWDWALTIEPPRRSWLDLTSEKQQFARVCAVAYRARRCPMVGLQMQGHQEYDTREIQTSLLAFASQIMEEQKVYDVE